MEAIEQLKWNERPVEWRRAYGREASRRWRATHLDHARAQGRASNRRVKLRVLELLGPFCAFCGETDPVVLELGHVIPVLREGKWKRGTLQRLIGRLRNGKDSPFAFQVICANCHARKTDIERMGYRRSRPGYGPMEPLAVAWKGGP